MQPPRACLCLAASCFRCLVDVVPVKNEEGVVIMFILNFEDLAQVIAKSGNRSLHRRLSQSWRGGGCHRGWWGQREGGAASSGLSPSHGFLGSSWGLKDAPVAGQDPAPRG